MIHVLDLFLPWKRYIWPPSKKLNAIDNFKRTTCISFTHFDDANLHERGDGSISKNYQIARHKHFYFSNKVIFWANWERTLFLIVDFGVVFLIYLCIKKWKKLKINRKHKLCY